MEHAHKFLLLTSPWRCVSRSLTSIGGWTLRSGWHGALVSVAEMGKLMNIQKTFRRSNAS
eukprot:2029565-Amphidinium_carterae.1